MADAEIGLLSSEQILYDMDAAPIATARMLAATIAELRARNTGLRERARRAEQALSACWLEMQWAGAHLDVMPDDYAEAMMSAGRISGAWSPPPAATETTTKEPNDV